MGLLDTFLNAVGLKRPLTPKSADRLLFSDEAKEALGKLAEDWALHISTSPQGKGHVVRVVEGPAEGPPPPGYSEAIVLSDRDLQRVQGLILDRRHDRWSMALDLSMYARETPNPNGRLYLTDRVLNRGQPLFYTDKTHNPPLADALLAHKDIVSVLFREHTVTVERRGEADWNKLDQDVDAALRQYLLLCGQALDSDNAPSWDDPLAAEVLAILQNTIIPAIHRDGGDLVFHGVNDGVVKVSLVGACASCPSSTVTLQSGIEKTLTDALPGRITGVEQV
jgi:NFU1 iron-sulfur cluster scaffold homolog, mitochondrial